MRTTTALIVGLLLTVPPAALGVQAPAMPELPDAAEAWVEPTKRPEAMPSAVAPDPWDLPLLTAPERWVVGMRGVPRDLEKGDLYQGALVVGLNRVLHYIAVETAHPQLFRSQAQQDPNVRYVEPDPVLQLISFAPNDPRWADQYGPQQVRANVAWDTSLGDTDAAVCVVDTGVRSTHEDLTGARWKGGRDIINNDNDPADDNGHGTHVTGTAAASINNGKGIAGVGNVAFYHAKGLDALGSGTWTQVADAITWCADNTIAPTVISMSLGGAGGATVLEDAVNYAWGAGKLLVAAAGNSGPCTNCVDYPGAYTNVMAITCTDSAEAQCGFSSDGPQSDLTAPGDGILSTCYTSDTAYCTKSGTSMSTPHAAGVAALVWSQSPTTTNANLRTSLQNNAKDLGAAGWDELYGHGLADAKATLDDIIGAPPPPAENQVLFENFDDGAANGWTLGGMWHVSSACATAPSAANYLGYNEDADCNYDNGATNTGTAKFTVDLTGATVGTLKFSQRREVESYAGGAYDIMRVQVSSDNGATWTTLKQWDSRDASQLAFATYTQDIDAYTGGSRQFRFFFDTVDGTANAYDGWFLDNVEVTADIGGGPAPNEPPVAAAGPDQTLGDADGSGNQAITLDGTGSTDSDGTITSYVWKEGATTLGSGATLTYTFAVGTHTVTLTVTDDDGATATDTMVATVNANQAPTAAYTYSCTDLSCTFNGAGSTDPDGTLNSYAWTFGDGGSASGSSTSHTYGAAGTYSVTLTVTDNGGATDGETKSITVNAPGGDVLVYSKDFEADSNGWTKSGGASDLWRRASGCWAGHSGTWSLQYNSANNDCDYSTGARTTGWARGPTIDLSGKTSATLKFWNVRQVESYAGGAYDIMRVQASSNNGGAWTTIKQWDSRDPAQLAWVQQSFDVSGYISAQFRVRYWFDSVDSTDNAYKGWGVDDVEVWAH